METKMTKIKWYGVIRTIVMESDYADKDGAIDFINKQVALIDAKAEKAKARAAEKKAEGDELRATVESLLTDEYQSAEAIAEQIDDPEVTKAKVVARLTQLVKAGVADKEQVKAEDGRKIMNYKLASESVDAE